MSERFMQFPAATRRDAAIQQWLRAQRDDLRPLVEKWFEYMRALGPDIRELMHDGMPTACIGEAALTYVNAFRDHANVGFFFGALLDDPARLLEGTGKRMRHVKLWPGEKVNEAALAKLIDAAYADLNQRLAESRGTSPD